MQDDFIDMMEPTPKLISTKCKLISFTLTIFLKYSIYFITIFTWYMYDYFIAASILLLSFLVIGIIRSYIRNSVIPPKQMEYPYNDKGIADWYTAKILCDDKLEIELENI